MTFGHGSHPLMILHIRLHPVSALRLRRLSAASQLAVPLAHNPHSVPNDPSVSAHGPRACAFTAEMKIEEAPIRTGRAARWIHRLTRQARRQFAG
jgi:hypothetical protein